MNVANANVDKIVVFMHVSFGSFKPFKFAEKIKKKKFQLNIHEFKSKLSKIYFEQMNCSYLRLRLLVKHATIETN